MKGISVSMLLAALALAQCGCAKYSSVDPKFEVEKTETKNGADVQSKYKYIALIWHDHFRTTVSTLAGEVIIESGPAQRRVQGPFRQEGKWPIPKSVSWVRPILVHWTDASGQVHKEYGSEDTGPSILLSEELIKE